MQGSSCPRPELGEFISPLLCGGAAAADARGAASRASGRRWPRSRRSPALPASLGLRLCRPPPRARPAPVLNGHRAAPAVSDVPSPAQGRGCSAAARRAPLTLPARPSPSRRRRASGGCSRGPPGDQRGEDTRFAGSRAAGSLGWSAPPQPPGAPSDHPLGPALSPCGGERPAVPTAGASLLGHWHLQRGLQGDQSPSGDGTAWTEA